MLLVFCKFKKDWRNLMKKRNLASVITTILVGTFTTSVAYAEPVASAQAIVSLENFTISRDGAVLDAATDFSSLSVTSNQQTGASVDGIGSTPSPTTSANDGSSLVSNSVIGALPASTFAALMGAGNTTAAPSDFIVTSLPETGNFAVSGSNEVGAPIANFGVSAQSDADLHNASYASLDSIAGSAGTTTRSNISSEVVFSGIGGVLDFAFDAGTYVEAFLSAGASTNAIATFGISFNLVEQFGNGQTGFSLLDGATLVTPFPAGVLTLGGLDGFSFSNEAADPEPGLGLPVGAVTNSLLNLDGTLVTSAFSFSTVALNATSTYVLTGSITTSADVVRAAVPEPTALMLVGVGLLGLGLTRKRSVQI